MKKDDQIGTCEKMLHVIYVSYEVLRASECEQKVWSGRSTADGHCLPAAANLATVLWQEKEGEEGPRRNREGHIH